MGRCSESRCRAPELTCHRGEAALGECDAWRKANGGRTGTPVAGTNGEALIPWTGTALGLENLAFVTARSEPKVVALIGPHNAGKTTLLASWYQLLGRAGSVGADGFAGSFSLEGWEAVSHGLRWEGVAPSFPPHTPAGDGRTPGLLHLAWRGADGRLRDTLFTDAPGEWFSRWATDRAAPDAEGARWVAAHASALVVVADCEALSGPRRGSARNDIQRLIQRVGAERRKRPVALLWTKADEDVPTAMRETIMGSAELELPGLTEFHVSVVGRNGDGDDQTATSGLMEVLAWGIAPMGRGFAGLEAPLPTSDPFFSLGSVQ